MRSIAPLAEQADYISGRKKLAELEARHSQAVEREHRARRKLRAEVSVLRTAAAADDDRQRLEADRRAALELAKGGRMATQSPANEVAAALEEQRLLQTLIVEARTELQLLVDRLSYEARSRLAGEIAAAKKRVAESFVEWQNARAALDEIPAALRAAGYPTWNADVVA